jgi:RNA polymerase sigma-70 factor (ECF subfamily)
MSLAIDWLRGKQGEDPMRYLDEVFRYAAARLGRREDAEDIAIEVVQSLPNPCFKRDLKVYMLGMARRKCIDRMRKHRPSADLRDCDTALRFDSASDEAAIVEMVMRELSDDHREALSLKYIAGLSSAEIGRITGRKPAAVDSMLQRAREAFAEHWTRISSDEVKQ